MKTVILSSNTSWYLYNFRRSTISRLLSIGYKVICVSPKDDYSVRLTQELGCEWEELKMNNKSSNPLKDLILFCRIIYIFFKLKPAAVFNFTIKNNIYGTWAAKIIGCKVFNNISGLGTAFINDNFTTKIVKSLYKLSQPFADRVFCQNPEDQEFLIKHKLVAKEKLYLLPGSGINISDFHPGLNKKRQEGSKFKFTFIGRMIGDKGIFELLQAAELLHNTGAKFDLVLCGPVGVNNKTAISRKKLLSFTDRSYLTWLGEIEDVRYVLSSSDCVVLPSYREGLPRTLLEAGAMAIPSITTDVPGCKHVIIDNYNGLLCEVRSAESLFKKMKKVLEIDDEEYKKMSTNSRLNVVKNYDENIVINSAVLALTEYNIS